MSKKEKGVKSTELMGSTIYFVQFVGFDFGANKDGFHYWGAFTTPCASWSSYFEPKIRRTTIYVDASTEGVYRLVFMEEEYDPLTPGVGQEFSEYINDCSHVVAWSERLPDETPELAGYRLLWAYVRLMDDLLPDHPEASSERFGTRWTDGSNYELKVLFVFIAVRIVELPWTFECHVKREAPAFMQQAILDRLISSKDFKPQNCARLRYARKSKKRKPMKEYELIHQMYLSDQHIKLRSIIAKQDPLGFAKTLCGAMEYDYETTHILCQIKDIKSIDEMHELIYDEFARKDKHRIIGPKEKYRQLAQDVFQKMKLGYLRY